MKCSKCKKFTEPYAFAVFRTRLGELRRRKICKECRNKYGIENFERLKEYRKKYYSNPIKRTEKREKDYNRRQEIKSIVDNIKLNSRCTDCKKKFPAVCMDFDHVKGKNRGVASMVASAYKIDLILEEIKLCEIVCACCHRIRTAKRKQNLSVKI